MKFIENDFLNFPNFINDKTINKVLSKFKSQYFKSV